MKTADVVPKRIADITIADLESQRWSYYHNDEEGYDCFEHAVPDNHPGFSEHAQQIELAYFEFPDGRTLKGAFYGAESFAIYFDGIWHSLWYGVKPPNQLEQARFSAFLNENQLALPVTALAKWSKTTRRYHGLQYINDAGKVSELFQ